MVIRAGEGIRLGVIGPIVMFCTEGGECRIAAALWRLIVYDTLEVTTTLKWTSNPTFYVLLRPFDINSGLMTSLLVTRSHPSKHTEYILFLFFPFSKMLVWLSIYTLVSFSCAFYILNHRTVVQFWWQLLWKWQFIFCSDTIALSCMHITLSS